MWPIDGGNLLVKETTLYDLLVTGHEDGSVKFWDIRSGNLSINCDVTIYRCLVYAYSFSVDVSNVGDTLVRVF